MHSVALQPLIYYIT